MGWIGWVYLAGAVFTMGMGVAAAARRNEQLDADHLTGAAFCGAIWPVLWCALAAYVILDRK